MKLTKRRLKEIIREEVSMARRRRDALVSPDAGGLSWRADDKKSEFNEVLQDAGGVWVIETSGLGSDESYLHPGNRWGPLWDPEVPDVVGALVFGDKAEAANYLEDNAISTDNYPHPSFYSDDDLEAMEMQAEEPTMHLSAPTRPRRRSSCLWGAKRPVAREALLGEVNENHQTKTKRDY